MQIRQLSVGKEAKVSLALLNYISNFEEQHYKIYQIVIYSLIGMSIFLTLRVLYIYKISILKILILFSLSLKFKNKIVKRFDEISNYA